MYNIVIVCICTSVTSFNKIGILGISLLRDYVLGDRDGRATSDTTIFQLF